MVHFSAKGVDSYKVAAPMQLGRTHAQRERLAILTRLGFKAVRWEFGGMTGMQPDGTIDWKTLDGPLGLMEQARLKLCVTLGAVPYWAMIYRGPAATITTQMQDHTPAPKFLDRYQQWVTAFCNRFWKSGNGSLWAIECWNEPWEPLSTSGWESDGAHYREVFRRLADGAHAVDPKIQTVAAGSIMNTEDKFLTGDDREQWMNRIDAITDHYVMPPTNYSSMVARSYGKKVFETETWGVTTDMMAYQFIAQFLACGDMMVNPTNSSQMYYFTPGSRDETQFPRPVNVSLAAINRFLTGRPFQRMLFLKSAPFAFQFGQDPDAVVILLGRLRPNLSAFGGGIHDSLWWQFNLTQGGTITIDNQDGGLEFYDYAGNRVYAGEQHITLPMDLEATYIRSPQGGVALIRDRLGSARIEGVRPVEIIARDMGAAVDTQGAHLTTTVHNLLNRRITGSLTITPPASMQFRSSSVEIELSAGDSKDVIFDIDKAIPSPANAYDFQWRFDGPDGHADWAETLHVLLARKSPRKMNGDLAEWASDLPVLVRSTGKKVDATVQAWQPFNKIVEQAPDTSFAEVKAAYDDQYMYVVARVNRAAPGTLHPRVSSWNEDSFFHGAAEDEFYESTLAKYEKFLAEDLKNAENVKRLEQDPGWPKFQEFLKVHPEVQEAMKGDQPLFYFNHRRNNQPIKWADASYVYRRDFFPEGPIGGDLFQVGFNALPGYAHHHIDVDTDRVPEGFHAMPDTDYEYSAYDCSDGGTELWRLLAPGVPRGHHFPRQTRSQFDQGPVRDGRCVVKREGKVTIYEISIPWTELKEWKPQPGQTFGFTFKAASAEGPAVIFGEGKSATKSNGLSLHPYWEAKPSCGVRWTLGG